MDSFGKKVRELRTAAGLSQEKLAEQLEIAEKTVQRYEKGLRPDTYGLAKLASFFNVSADYLLGYDKKQMLSVEGLTDDDIGLISSMITKLKEVRQAEKPDD